MQSSECTYARCTLRKDGILQIDYFPEHTITREEAREVFLHGQELTHSKKGKFPILAVMGNNTNFTESAKEFYASEYVLKNVCAQALVLKNLFQVTVVNLFIRINKPKVPTRFFTKVEYAVEWINKNYPSEIQL